VAGLHLLVTLPQLDGEAAGTIDRTIGSLHGGADGDLAEAADTVLAGRARRAGVAVHPLSRHRLTPGPPGLVLGYAAATPDQLREAARRLGELVV